MPSRSSAAGFPITVQAATNSVRLSAVTVPAGRLVWYSGASLDAITNVVQIEEFPLVQHDFLLPKLSSSTFFRAARFDTNVEVTPLAIGSDHAVAITTNGMIESWGDNSYGQFGNGVPITENFFYYAACWGEPTGFTNTSQGPLPESSDTDWVSVAAGAHHTLALKANGTLWAWGNNAGGQLGYTNEGYAVSSPSAVPIGTNVLWRSVFAVGSSSFAIGRDGTLWAWGDNASSILGLGTNFSNSNTVWAPTQAGTSSNWVKVVCYPNHAVGIRSDGTLWAWGSTDLPSYIRTGYTETNLTVPITTSPAQVSIPGPWVGAAPNPVIGGDFLFLRADGTLWETLTNASDNYNWMTYFGFWQNQYTNSASLYNVLIDAGITPTNAYAYVDNTEFIPEYPTLTNFSPAFFSNFVQSVSDANFFQPASSRNGWTMLSTEIALNRDGTVWTIGDDPTRSPGSPRDGAWQRLDAETDWRYVCGNYLGLKAAVKSDGSVWVWDMAGGLYLNGPLLNEPVKVPINKWISAKVTATHTVALDAQSNLWVWGGNTAGQLGVGDYEPRLAPTELPMAGPWLSFAVNDYETVAVHQGGELWAWGNINPSQTNASNPVRLNPARLWSAVYAPNETSATNFCAIARDGTLWQFGGLTPQEIGGSNWAYASPSLENTLALQTDGTLWAWGTNFGFGLTNFYTNAVQVSGDAWTDVSVGHTPGNTAFYDYDTNSNSAADGRGTDGFAIRSDGTLWAWGVDDSSCQLGLVSDVTWANTNCWTCVLPPCGNPSPVIIPYGTNVIVFPQQVGTDNDWKEVSYSATVGTSFQYTIGLKQDGSMWVWGWSPFTNVVSQDILLPPPSSPYPDVPYPALANILIYPYPVGTNTWSYVDRTAGVTTSGDLYLWGRTQASVEKTLHGPLIETVGYFWGEENQDGQMLVPPTWSPQLVPSNVVCRLPPSIP
ncbi:MAG TPA: hypothetical protein VGO67_10450 [Verrucomicrobiae bacterium]|jgi:alpha-tubulin suppressor-like RCC1 family protein